MNSGKLSRPEERWMPLSKKSVDVPNSIYESGIEAVKSSNDSSYHLSQKRNNSLHMPLEDHWRLPQEAKKQSSSSKISFRSMMLSSVKFRDSLKQMGRSKTIKTTLEDPHDLKDEQLVQSFRKLLILDGQLPEKHDDYHTLLCFLRMRNFDLPKAKTMYLNMLKWRNDFSVDTIAMDFKFEEYEEVKKVYPHGFHSVDRCGRPLYIERIGLLDINALLQVTTVERFMKYHIFEKEKTVNLRYPACSLAAKSHIASTTAIVDVKGVTLHQLFIVNAGSGFKALWQVLKGFLDPKTLSKIHVLGGKYQSKLVEVIDSSNLPDYLGGKCTCSEYGDCLLKDRGPWCDPEITDALQGIYTAEWMLGEDVAMEKVSEINIDDAHFPSTFKECASGRLLEQREQIKDVSELLSSEILALETGLGETKMILEMLVSKQHELAEHLDQLKELAFTR